MHHITGENFEEYNGPYLKNKMEKRKLEEMKVTKGSDNYHSTQNSRKQTTMDYGASVATTTTRTLQSTASTRLPRPRQWPPEGQWLSEDRLISDPSEG